MRSLVESANKTLKSKNFEDLANVSKRSGRGFAFNYLAATLAAVSSNLRKIFDFFVKTAERDSGESFPRTQTQRSHRNAADQAQRTAGALTSAVADATTNSERQHDH
jgi:hypothetical protein